MKNITLLLLIFLGIQSFQNSNAQIVQTSEIDTNTYVITRSNGNELIGKIISDDGREVLIQTNTLGKIYVPKANIISIKKINVSKEIVNGEYRSNNPFTTRYQFSTNAFPIKKGENYAAINLYGPEVHFAVSNRLSIGIMATWIASPLVLALKYTIPTKNEKVNFGFGTLLGSTGYLNQGRGFGGLHWGMMTYGNRMNNITLSLGYSYIKVNNTNAYKEGNYPAVADPFNPGSMKFQSLTLSKKPLTNAPIIGVGGITSIGKKVSLFVDAMLLFGSSTSQDVNQYYNNQGKPSYTSVVNRKLKSTNFILMPGLRFQKTENTAFQVSLAGIVGSIEGDRYSFPIPMCTWFFKF
jgi:hypothetical protein